MTRGRELKIRATSTRFPFAMSHSRRKTPVFGFTAAVSEKQDKRWANRRLRRAVRQGRRDLRLREVSNVWAFAKDGKNTGPTARPAIGGSSFGASDRLLYFWL